MRYKRKEDENVNLIAENKRLREEITELKRRLGEIPKTSIDCDRDWCGIGGYLCSRCS